ncbi:hypothetical protein TWF788_009152 [Orbilia oligospora]|uniref:Uncharacterized protein n=1 Tax=Orbilia oligospora TaxID=2813651 RepID=A0A7C8PM62_ORBOL|nr:hypothetical protein TWF788_009152 [Orbilia oligospora]
MERLVQNCDECRGWSELQSYANTVITLASADKKFEGSIAMIAGATYGGLTSSEGGKGWSIASIKTPTMSKAPCTGYIKNHG